MLWLAALDATMIGLLVALTLLHHRTLALVVSIILIPILVAVWHLPDKLGDDLDRWVLGFKGERSIGELLNELRSERFTVMHDIAQTGEGNIDHLVSGPTGVFMIESKAKGYQQEALLKARRQAAKIHDELDNWVMPVICIHERDRKPFKHERVWIVPEQHLLDWIRSQRNQPVPFERLARYADTVS
jgi:hypothetical protein